MANGHASSRNARDDALLARVHVVLRFSVGVTAAFIISEAMGWYPTFLAPVLAAVLLANLPRALPLKAGLFLVGMQGAASFAAYVLTSLLLQVPIVLFGGIGLIIFLCFATLAHGRGFLPIFLLLISISVIPVIAITMPQQAGALPMAFTRSMAVAVSVTWLVHAFWPRLANVAPPAGLAAATSPVRMALIGTAIVLPLMLFYLMYGITDALPVLITTIVLVINFDPRRGASQGLAMMIGNLIGGLIATLAYAALRIAPSLTTLALLTFFVALLFAIRIERGGPAAAVAVITFNQTMIMFSLALIPESSSAGLWATRLLQFGIAFAFAIAMMSLLFPREKPDAATSPA